MVWSLFTPPLPPLMTDFIAITTPSPTWITDLHSADRATSYKSDFFALPVFYYFILFFHIFLFKYSDLKIGPAAYALTAKCLLGIFNDLRGGGAFIHHVQQTYTRVIGKKARLFKRLFHSFDFYST